MNFQTFPIEQFPYKVEKTDLITHQTNIQYVENKEDALAVVNKTDTDTYRSCWSREDHQCILETPELRAI